MEMHARLHAPSEWTGTSFEEILGRTLEVGPRSMLEVIHLDTFDWRVFRAGASLKLEIEGNRRTLHWEPGDETAPYMLPVDGAVRFASDVPEGFLRSTLEPILEFRALLPMGTSRVARRHLRVVGEEGSTLLHLVFQRSTVVDGSGAPVGEPMTSIRMVAGTGHESVYDEAVERLRSAGAVDAPADHELAATAAAIGRAPGDYSSKINITLDPGERAGLAVRTILAHLLATIRANVDGVLADTDTEFLHDLRVATRRARSALAQMKRELDGDAPAALRNELKWLGGVTNPLRDLDVYLLELNVFRDQVGSVAHDLDPLEHMIKRDRQKALRSVRRGLRSARFSSLLDGWDDVVSSAPDAVHDSPDAARPIADVAGEQILEAYRKMVKRGSKLGEVPPPEALHRLRIDGKKLRYLLEFFASLYPAKTIARMVKELKQLQDILGGFNDMRVQQERLVESARELIASGEARAETLLAMGRLAAAMSRRQEELLRGFDSAFSSFTSKGSQRRYGSLVSGGEG